MTMVKPFRPDYNACIHIAPLSPRTTLALMGTVIDHKTDTLVGVLTDTPLTKDTMVVTVAPQTEGTMPTTATLKLPNAFGYARDPTAVTGSWCLRISSKPRCFRGSYKQSVSNTYSCVNSRQGQHVAECPQTLASHTR